MNRYVSVQELVDGILNDHPKDVVLYIANFPYTDMPLMNGDTLVLDHSKANEIERVIIRSDGSGWCFQKGSGDVEVKWLENKDGTKDIIYSHKEVLKHTPQLEGEWLEVSVEGWDLINRPMIRCSHCGWTFSVALNPRNYCPSCGAKMVNEDDNTD